MQIAVRHIQRMAVAMACDEHALEPSVVWLQALHDVRAVADAYGAEWDAVFKALSITVEMFHTMVEQRGRTRGHQWTLLNVPTDRHRLEDVPDITNNPALYYRGPSECVDEDGSKASIVLFATDQNIRDLFNAQHLQADATFDTVCHR